MGHPGKLRRELTERDLESIDAYASRYVEYAETYRHEPPESAPGSRAAMKFQAIKGVRDILPPESALWNRVEQAAREVFAAYGYGDIRLPIFEPTELFARSWLELTVTGCCVEGDVTAPRSIVPSCWKTVLEESLPRRH